MSEGNGKATATRRTTALQKATKQNRDLVLLVSDLSRRLRFAQRAGLQYDGVRDVYQLAGYIPEGNDDFNYYYSLYRRNEIAGRIVDLPADYTWKKPPEIKETGKSGDKKTKFEKDFAALAKRLKIWHMFSRADRLSRIGRYGVVLIGTKGTDAELAQEIGKLKKPDDIIYLSVFPEGYAEIKEWETDTSNPRFGMPRMYEIDLSSGVKGFPAAKAMVHASRVLHIAEGLLADEVYGRPALQRVLNRLMDLDKISASTAESFWQVAARVLMAEVDPDTEITPAQLDDLGAKMEQIVHDLRRQMLMQGGKLSWLTTTAPDPSVAMDFYFSLVSAGSNIPRRILFGSERGELASQQDERAYQAQVTSRQEQFAEPQMVRAFIDFCVETGALAGPGEDGYEVVWSPGYEQTEQEQADLNLARANTAKALVPIGGDPLRLVEIDEEGAVTLKSSDVIEQEAIDNPPPEATPTEVTQPGQTAPQKSPDSQAQPSNGGRPSAPAAAGAGGAQG